MHQKVLGTTGLKLGTVAEIENVSRVSG